MLPTTTIATNPHVNHRQRIACAPKSTLQSPCSPTNPHPARRQSKNNNMFQNTLRKAAYAAFPSHHHRASSTFFPHHRGFSTVKTLMDAPLLDKLAIAGVNTVGIAVTFGIYKVYRYLSGEIQRVSDKKASYDLQLERLHKRAALSLYIAQLCRAPLRFQEDV